MVFHKRSNYDYHFIIKELVKQFKEQFNCLRKNTKKYKTFSIPITKEVKSIGINGENNKSSILQLQFIDSTTFMVSSSSNLPKRIDKANINMTIILVKYNFKQLRKIHSTFLQRFKCSCTHFQAIIFSVNRKKSTRLSRLKR